MVTALEIEGWMTELELDWLRDQAGAFDSVLEIGCWKGRSAAALAEGCPGRVVTVDQFDAEFYDTATYRPGSEGVDVEAVARENLSRFDNVTILRMANADAPAFLGYEVFDMVFIDGDHSEEAVREDIRLWTPFAAKVLCGHDRELPGVAAAIEGLGWSAGPDSIWWVGQ